MKRTLTLALLLIARVTLAQTQTPTPPVWPQEPLAYRGVGFNVATMTEARGRMGPTARCSGDAYFTQAGVKFPVGNCYVTNSIGDIPVTELWDFQNDVSGTLVMVSLTFKSDRYKDLREAFIGKYGPPHRVQTETLKTMMNVSVENETLDWVGPTMTVHLQRYGGKIDESFASIVTVEHMNAVARKREALKKKAQEDF